MACLVSCDALEKVSPFYDVLRRVISSSMYNGFGVFNMKLVAGKMASSELETYMATLPHLTAMSNELVHGTGATSVPSAGPGSTVFTDFTDIKSSFYPEEHGAIPKIFEVGIYASRD